VEHGGTRTQYAHLIDQYYRTDYEVIFGPLPDLSDLARFPANAGPLGDVQAQAAWEAMNPGDRDAVNRIYANMGKAIAAYERLILPGPSRFDAYVEALLEGDEESMNAALTADEVGGLRLFIGDAGCIKCHHGPLFTSNTFHNTGVPPRADTPPDAGRQLAVAKVLADEFNCLGPYSDAGPDDCVKLKSLPDSGEALAGAFKPPMLRNIAETAPYMHAGQYTNLFMVVRHYRHPPAAAIGQSELEPVMFMHTGMIQLEAFLHSLSGPLTTPAKWLDAPK
jgi:cytochrome c peroxidase